MVKDRLEEWLPDLTASWFLVMDFEKKFKMALKILFLLFL